MCFGYAAPHIRNLEHLSDIFHLPQVDWTEDNVAVGDRVYGSQQLRKPLSRRTETNNGYLEAIMSTKGSKS